MSAEYTDAELLIEVRAAIRKVAIAGQDYTIGDVRYTRADLSQLTALERSLTNRINTAASAGGRTLAEF